MTLFHALRVLYRRRVTYGDLVLCHVFLRAFTGSISCSVHHGVVAASPVIVYALVTRQTRAMHDLVPQFVAEHVMADFGRRPLLLFIDALSVHQKKPN